MKFQQLTPAGTAARNGSGGNPGPLGPAGNPEALQAALDAVKAAREAEGNKPDRAERAARISGVIQTAATASPPLSQIEISALRGAIATDRPTFMNTGEFNSAFKAARPESSRRVHEVNVTDEGFTFTCGIQGCNICGGRTAFLFIETKSELGEKKIPLPRVIARAISGPKHSTETRYVLARPQDTRGRNIDWREVDSGEWADLLRMERSSSVQVIKAAGTAIRQIAYSEVGGVPVAPEIKATISPRDRTDSGHLPTPNRDTTPLGYLEVPEDIDESDQEGFRQALISYAAKCPKVALFMGASAGAPFTVAAISGGQRHTWDAYGEPRQGKTTALTAAASIWGDPNLAASDGLIIPANATALGAASRAGLLGIVPIFMDEIASGDWNRELRVRFLMAMAQGGTRTRAKRQGHGEDITPAFNSVLFVTGNEMFTGGMEGGLAQGAISRVVEIAAPFTTDGETAGIIEEAAKSSYGYFGPRILTEVTPAQFRAGAEQIGSEFPGIDEGVTGTRIRYMVTAIMGARVIDSIAEPGGPVPGALETAARFAALEYLGESQDLVPNSQLALNRIHEMYVTEPARWPNQKQYEGGHGTDNEVLPPGGYSKVFSGFQDDSYFYVLPATWDQVVKDTGIAADAALKQMGESGALEIPPSLKSGGNKRWKVPGPRWAKRPPCYRIVRDHVTGPDGESGEDDGGQDEPGPGPAQDGPGDQGTLDPQDSPEDSPSGPQAVLAAPGGPIGDLAARRADWVAQARERGTVRDEFQAGKLLAGLAAIDEGKPPRTLDALEGHGDKSGAFAPRMRKAPQHPYWTWKGWEGPIDSGRFISCETYSYQATPAYTGPVVGLDRNAAFVSAISSVQICPDKLEKSGQIDLGDMGSVKPGIYLMKAYPWTEPGLPSPFPGAAEPGKSYWLASPIAGLLGELAKAGRWPDSVAEDSWIGDRAVRLDKWGHFIAEMRNYALTYYGRDSDNYAFQKEGYSQAVTLMRGKREDRKLVHACKCTRRDWAEMIKAQNGVTLWRTGDKLGGVTAMGNIDSLTVPADRAESAIRNGVIRVDETGATLGTFHIRED